jgi:hypothetical protein
VKKALYQTNAVWQFGVIQMTSVMKKLDLRSIEDKEIQTWGKAELTDSWVILHKQGGPKWAIYYKEKNPKIAVPYRVRSFHRKK